MVWYLEPVSCCERIVLLDLCNPWIEILDFRVLPVIPLCGDVHSYKGQSLSSSSAASLWILILLTAKGFFFKIVFHGILRWVFFYEKRILYLWCTEADRFHNLELLHVHVCTFKFIHMICSVWFCSYYLYSFSSSIGRYMLLR